MKSSKKIRADSLIIICTAIVVLSVGSHFWFKTETDPQEKEGTANNWQTFQNNEFDFTFRYPSEAIVDISGPAIASERKRVRVRFIGPESEPNTEITDGFTFYVRSVSMGNGESLSEVAKQIFNSLPDRNEIIKKLPEGPEIGGRNTYTFSFRSELGSIVDFTIMESTDDIVFVTTTSIATPENFKRNYDTVIRRIRQSLKPTS